MSKLIEKEGKFYKECGVVMLETTSSKVLLSEKGQLYYYHKEQKSGSVIEPQHLYITSNDEIKEGDWVYHNTGYVSIVLGFNLDAIKLIDAQRWTEDCKKIIATTDKTLVNDNNSFLGKPLILPQPSDKFIQAYIDAYNKGEKIKKVLVEYEFGNISESCFDGEVEKLPLKLKLKDNNIIIKKVKDSWTREEVINLLHSAGKYGRETANKSIGEMPDMMDKWIEKNL